MGPAPFRLPEADTGSCRLDRSLRGHAHPWTHESVFQMEFQSKQNLTGRNGNETPDHRYQIRLGRNFCCRLFHHRYPGRRESRGGSSKRLFRLFLFWRGISGRDLSLDDASGDDNKTIGSLHQSARGPSRFVPIIGGALNYNNDSTGTMASLNAEDGFRLDITQHAGGLGLFMAGVYYAEEDVWADPFLTGRARSKTGRETVGIAAGWEEILASGFTLLYALETIDIENDIAGKRDTRLKRDGNLHNMELSYTILEMDRHFLSTGLVCEIGDLDGSAQALQGLRPFRLIHFQQGP